MNKHIKTNNVLGLSDNIGEQNGQVLISEAIMDEEKQILIENGNIAMITKN